MSVGRRSRGCDGRGISGNEERGSREVRVSCGKESRGRSVRDGEVGNRRRRGEVRKERGCEVEVREGELGEKSRRREGKVCHGEN